MKATTTLLTRISICAGVALFAACSGPQAPATASLQQPAAHDESHHEGKKHDPHQHHFPGVVNDFHDVLAPLWHAQTGPERTQNTCAAAARMHEMAQAIESGEVPAEARENADAWREATAAMTARAADLLSGCSQDPEAFEANFAALHDAFHGVIKLIGHKDK